MQQEPNFQRSEWSFGVLSFVCFVLGASPSPASPPPPPFSLLPSPLSVCLLPDEFVSLSGFSQTLRHLLPTDTQTLR